MAEPRVALPQTKHSVFYSYAIAFNGNQIGSFSKFSSSMSRSPERIREVLFSRGAEVKEIVWGGTDITVSIDHAELYKESLLKIIGTELFSLEEWNFPVDIVEVQYVPAEFNGIRPTTAGTTGQRIITYKDCVPSSYNKAADVGTAHIAESMEFWCRTIVGTRV